MEKAGASVVIEEKELTKEYLSLKIDEIIKKNRIGLMSEASGKMSRPYAAKEIVEQLYSLVGK